MAFCMLQVQMSGSVLVSGLPSTLQQKILKNSLPISL